jgi:GAF domain-containing protein
MNDPGELQQNQLPLQVEEPAPRMDQKAQEGGQPPALGAEPGASMLRTILPILAGATFLVYLTMITAPNPRAVFLVTTLMLVVEGIAYAILRFKRARASGIVLTSGLWLVLAITAYYSEGVSNAPYIGLVIVVLIAGLVIRGNSGWIFAALNAVLGFVLVVASLSGNLPTAFIPYHPVSFWIAMVVISIASAGLITLAVNQLQAVLTQSQRQARAMAQTNRELGALRTELEHQAAERIRQLQERTHYLEAAIEISRATSSTLDREQLMQVVVTLICEQFSLDYAGLYLVDPTNTWAILRAEHNAPGSPMEIRGGDSNPPVGGDGDGARYLETAPPSPQDARQIPLGAGLIGLCIANAQPRLGQTQDFQGQPGSEAAIPLRSRDKIIGGLHMVSREGSSAFDEAKIIIFQTIGDQIAIALENASLYQENLLAQSEMQRASGKASQEAWNEILRRGTNLSFRYDRSADRIMPLQAEQATATQENDTLLLPIPVRDQVVGTIHLTKGTERPSKTEAGPESMAAFNDEEITLLRTIIEQLGIALDSSRLYQDTQRLAYREQLTSEVTTRIRETLNIETVLKTAVEEIQKTLGLSEVVISLAEGQEWFVSRPTISVQARPDGVTQSGSVWYPEMQQAIHLGKPVFGPQNPEGQTLARMAIPIQVRGTVIGAINTSRPIAPTAGATGSEGTPQDQQGQAATPENQWTSDEIAFLEAVAEQLGVALDSARLYAETQQRAEQERLVSEVTSRIRASLDMKTVLATATREMCEILRLAEAEIRLGQGDGPLPEVQGLTQDESAAEQERQHTQEALRGAPQDEAVLLRAQQDLGYYCRAGGEPQPLRGPWRPEMSEARLAGRRLQPNDWTLVIPIKIRQETTGVLLLCKSPGSGVWTAHEIDLVEILSDRLSAALESAQLYEETRRRAERERLTSEITARLRASNDPQTILQTAASELRRALRADKTKVIIQPLTELNPETKPADSEPGPEHPEGQ